jgi:RHS repeat-associated protein
MPSTPTLSAASVAQGAFEVDASGQATYKIPLDLPPGIANVQPSLALGYSHRQPNGVLGVGWSLTGQSAITRVKATYAVDGFNGAVSYGPDDRFALDGLRLINVQGDYGAAGTVYRTESETWSYVLAGSSPAAGFKVWSKSGELLAYGTTDNSRIRAPGTSNVRVWALAAMTDRNGNRIDLEYTLSPDGQGDGDGSYFLRRIAYTVRDDGARANRFVDFAYERRPDPIEDYVAGYPAHLSYRMTRITTSIDAGEVVRTIAIDYRTSIATELSCISSITLSGAQSDGSPALPPTTLVWQDVASPGFDIGARSILDQHLGAPDIRTMDVNGDGRTDIVQLWTDDQQALHATTYLATPAPGGEVVFVRASDTSLGSFPAQREIVATDLDGDGKADLLVVYAGGPDKELRLAAFLSNGKGFDDGGIFRTGDTWSTKHIQFFSIDANGDGRTDLVEAYAHRDPDQGDLLYFRSYLSKFGDGTGKMFSSAIVSPTADPAYPTHVLAFLPMDVNGDGMIDLVRVQQDGSSQTVTATAYLGASRSIDDVSFASSVASDLGAFNLTNQIALLPVDVNGDGVLDLLRIWKEVGSSSTTLHLSTFLCNAAGGFAAGPDSAFRDQTIDPSGFYAMDLDGSGLTAIVNKWISGNDRLMFTAFRASPSGRYRVLPPFDAGTAGSTVTSARFAPGDANGDGKADLLRIGADVDQRIEVVPYTSSGAYPDVVSMIVDPLGGSVALTYSPLSDATVYGPGDPLTFPASAGQRYPNPMTPTQYPIQAVIGRATYVVAQYAQRNDPTRNRFTYGTTHTMTYAGGQLDLLGRGWQGFATVTDLTLESGLVTVEAYLQDFPYTGMKAASRVAANGAYTTDPRVPTGQIVLMTSTATAYHAFVRATGATAPYPPVYETLRTESRWESWNYGAFDFALAHRYGYDDYGNETLDANLGYVDGGNRPVVPSEAVYQHRQFQNDLLPQGWALGFLRYHKESGNLEDPDITRFLPGDYHLQASAYTASTYNLASQGQWDDVHGAYLTIRYGYDAFGNKTVETKPGDLTTSYEYDPTYHTYVMRTTTPPDDKGTPLVTTCGYDPRFGIKVADGDANGIITVAQLDAFGRRALGQGPVPAGTQSDPNAVSPLVTGSPALREAFRTATVVTTQLTAYLDDSAGGIYSETRTLQAFPTGVDRERLWTRSYVDGRARSRETVRQTGQSAGDAIVITDYAGEQVSSESLPFFSPSSIVSAAPFATTSQYDVLGRPIRRSVPGGRDGKAAQITTWFYGTGGAVTITRAPGAPEQQVELQVHHYYNSKDKVISVTIDPGGANATTSYSFDPVARLVAVVDPRTAANPDGVPNTLAYDSLDRRTWMNNADQNTTGNPLVKAMTYAYDPATGLPSSQTDASGATTAYSHDGLGRVIRKAFDDGRAFTYTYDDAASNGNGRLSRVVARLGDGTLESQRDYGYDAYGNVSSSVLAVHGEARPFEIRSVFDPVQRLVAQLYPDATSLARSYAYGQLVGQTLDGARTDYPLEDYNPWQRPGTSIGGQGIVPAGGVVAHYAFNPLGQVIDETVTAAGVTVLDHGYRYDLLDQLLEVSDRAGGSSQAFGYERRRLVSATVPGFPAAAYVYDNSGNLTAKDGVAYTMQAHFATTGVLRGEQVFVATADACGRTRSRTARGVTFGFEYDGMSCLRRVSSGTGATLREMMSDFLGRLIREIDASGNVTIHVDPVYQVHRRAGGADTVTKYLLDDRGTAAAITTSQGVSYFRRDFKASNTHAFGTAGTVIAEIAYGGFGERKVVSGAAFLPEYEQRQWDAEIGLYNFGARYYDPMIGRFLTPDNQPGSDDLLQPDAFNRFAFELNNPVNLVDPTGHAAWIAGLVLAVVLFVVGAVAIVATGGAATPGVVAAGAIIGNGLASAGISGTVYSVTHRDTRGGAFWKGYAVNVGAAAVVGAATGAAAIGFGAVVNNAALALVRAAAVRGIQAVSANFIQGATRATLWAAFGASTAASGDTFQRFIANVTDREILHNSRVHLDDGLWQSALIGLGIGAAAGVARGVAEGAYGTTLWGGDLDRLPVELPTLGVPAPPGNAVALFPPSFSITNTVQSRLVLFGVNQAFRGTDAGLRTVVAMV